VQQLQLIKVLWYKPYQGENGVEKISYLKNVGMAEAEVFIEPVASVIKLFMSVICERS
jgi:hypothetical protein